MRLKVERNWVKALLLVVSTALWLAAPSRVYGQLAGNVYTPISVYGIGSMEVQGNSVTKQMGGIGAAMRSAIFQNNVNPASYSAVPQKTFLMSMGMQGVSNYLATEDATSSHNGMTLGDFGILFPLAKKIGLGVSITPMTTMGYNTESNEVTDDFLTNIGTLSENYNGSGNIVQYKLGVGLTIYKGLSIGANVAYYHGEINKYNSLTVNPVITDQEYRTVGTIATKEYNYIGGDIGLQYSLLLNRSKNRALTFGLVYQPKVTSTVEDTYLAASSSTYINDTASYYKRDAEFTMPSKITAGVMYSSRKVEVGVDYIYQDWTNAYDVETSEITLKEYQDFRFGIQFTPNRFDIRNMFKRWSYRAGFRYGQSYMIYNGVELTDYAFTMGVGIPLEKGSYTLLNVGGEVGKSGSLSAGQVRDIYVKIHLGVTLFGHSEWFTRYKFK